MKNTITSSTDVQKDTGMKKRIITQKPDPEWDLWLQKQWWYDRNTIQAALFQNPSMDNRLLELHNKLLSLGGYRTCLPVREADLNNILDRGQLWYGDGAILISGLPSQCHRNSALCWGANPTKTTLCTGYALSKDGLWRQHSWLFSIPTQRVIETTVPRVAYFGFAMTKEEALQFLAENN